MYRRAGRINRVWLAVLGVVLLAAGGAALVLAFVPGVAGRGGSSPVLPAGAAESVDTSSAAILLAVGGLVLVALSLVWLWAQVPSRGGAKPLRLHGDLRSGTTVLAPSVLTRAVEQQIEALPGVIDAAVLLRGSARRPELMIRVTADERSDLGELLARVHTDVVGDLGRALDTTPHHVGVRLEVGRSNRSASSVTF